MSKLPPSNLGPQSEPWARAIEDQTLQNATGIERIGGDASNDGRINNSTLDLMAGQIKEINARQAATVFASTITTPTYDETGNTVTASATLQLPRPADGQRSGWVTVSGTPGVSPALDSAVFITFMIDDRVFYRSSVGLPILDSTPVGWTAVSFTGATGFTATPGSGGTIGITLQAFGQAFGSVGNRQATFSGISATVSYGQKE